MECNHDRVFYYWRRGLYGHILVLCAKQHAEQPNDIFYSLWKGLVKGILKKTAKALAEIEKLECREDLSLLVASARYCINNVSDNSDDYTKKKDTDAIKNNIENANIFSLSFTARVLLMFKQYGIIKILIDKRGKEIEHSILGWMYLIRNNIEKSKKEFEISINVDNTQDAFTLYGCALCLLEFKDMKKCMETLKQIETTFNFPEMIIEQLRITILNGAKFNASNIERIITSNIDKSLEIELVRVFAALTTEGDLDAAVESCAKIVELSMLIEKDNWYFLNQISFELVILSNHNTKIVDLTSKLAHQATKIAPWVGFSHFNYSFHQIITSNNGFTYRTLMKGLEIDPINSFGNECKVRLSMNKSQQQEARDLLDFMMFEKGSEFQYSLFSIYLDRITNSSQNNTPEVYNRLLETLKSYVNNPRVIHEIFDHKISIKSDFNFIKMIFFRIDLVIEALDELLSYSFHPECLDIIEKIQKIVPGHSPIIFMKGLALMHLQRFEEAANAFRSILISAWPFRSSWCLTYAGYCLIECGNQKMALECMEEVSQSDRAISNDPKFRVALARVEASVLNKPTKLDEVEAILEGADPSFEMEFVATLIDCGETNRAARILKRIVPKLQTNMEKGTALLLQAKILAAGGSTERAFQILNKAKGSKKTYKMALLTEGSIHRFLLNDENAYLRVFEEAAEKENSLEYFELLGDAYSSVLAFGESVDAYEKAMANNSKKTVFKYIKALVNAHRYEQAVTVFTTNSLSASLDSLFLIDLFIKLKRFDSALQCLESSRNFAQPSDVLLLADINKLTALVYSKNKEYEKSKEFYGRALDGYESVIHPNIKNCFVRSIKREASEVAVALGNVQKELGDKEIALVYFNRGYQLNDSNSEAVKAIFDYYKEKDDTIKCVNICSEYLLKYPDDEQIAFLLTSVERKKFTNSIRCLSVLISNHHEFVRAVVRLVEICGRAGHLEIAANVVKKYDGETSPGIEFARGLLAYNYGRNKEAIDQFEKVASDRQWGIAARRAEFHVLVNPQRLYIWCTDRSISTVGNLEKAKSLVGRMAQTDEMRTVLLADLFSATNTLESVAEGERLYQDALRINSQNIQAMLGVARCALRRGDPIRAERYLTRILQTNATHQNYTIIEEARLMRCKIALDSGDVMNAQANVNIALELNKSSSLALEYAAGIHMSTKMYYQAAEELKQLWLIRDKADAEIGYKLSYALMMSGEPENALNICREVNNIHPNFRDLREKVMIPSYLQLRPYLV